MGLTYYVIKINYQVVGKLPGTYKCWTEYARKCDITRSWYSTDVMYDGSRFESLKKAAAAARRLNICKRAISRGGDWEIIEVTERTVGDSRTHGPKMM